MTESSKVKTCFISAPLGTDLSGLRAALKSRGVHALVPQELTVGADWASEIQRQIARADLVIGVIPSERQAAWVLFELGQASALGRRILLITSPKADPVPFSLHQFVVLRIDPTNSEAIGLALDQVIRAPEPTKERTALRQSATGLGNRADELLGQLDTSLKSGSWTAVEQLVAETLRLSGADVVATSPARDVGADFAVWSDVLEPFVGNPLLIEVKARLTSKTAAHQAVRHLSSLVGASGSRWALLLYGEGPRHELELGLGRQHPNVLILSLDSLLEGLRRQSFPELIRDLRNRRVHGEIS